jgi:hypothetical protein
VALRKGVSIGELHRTCGVSWSQVVAWRDRPAKSKEAAAESVRVFSVVDEPLIPGPEPSAAISSDQELELRLGPWSVRVRIADLGNGRG